MRIVYAVCSWGLGHATRSLPVIRKLIDEDNELTIISHDRSLELLKKELGPNLEYFDIKDYPMLLSENSRQFMAKSMIYWPQFIGRLIKGNQGLLKILKHKKHDIIISDGRYDIYSKKIPSFFISHMMKILNPLRIKMFERGSEIFNLFFFKRFAGVLIPDYRDENNLSGDLSHNLHRIDENKLHYVGVLSDFKKKNIKKDIDYLISITGPEPQRSILEKKLLTQATTLDGKIVATLGKTETKNIVKNDNIEIHSFMTKEERENILNRSKLIISRSGYSTILDLAVIGAKALMTPTPGQTEQEYLAEYHNSKNTFYSVNQDKIDLINDIKKAKKTTGINWECNVDKSVENIMNVITNVKKSPFQ
jgi:uncharacterized protein (TIGR00661 family)